METLEHPFNVPIRALPGRDGEHALRRDWRRFTESGSGNPLPRRDVGNGLFPTPCLADTLFGLICMNIVTKQFEVAPRSVPRCRWVPSRGGSPSQEVSEEGNRR